MATCIYKDIEDLKALAHAQEQSINNTQVGLEKCFERIEKLESDQLGEKLDPKVWDYLNDRVDSLETELYVVRALGSRAYHPKKPHKCPVCDEKPIQVLNIVRTESGNDKLVIECPVCEGSGIVWG